MRACGSAWIEAELGALPGDEDVSTNALPSQTMTDPRQAREFVERTGIDALAVAVGNVHGFTACPVTLDLERLHAIAEKCPVSLVLHGASGLPPEQLRGALSCGVAKVNVNAELRRAYLGAVERSLPKAMPTADAVAVWQEGRAAVTVAALRIIRSLSVGGTLRTKLGACQVQNAAPAPPLAHVPRTKSGVIPLAAPFLGAVRRRVGGLADAG